MFIASAPGIAFHKPFVYDKKIPCFFLSRYRLFLIEHDFFVYFCPWNKAVPRKQALEQHDCLFILTYKIWDFCGFPEQKLNS